MSTRFPNRDGRYAWEELAAGERTPGETWIQGPKAELQIEGKVSGRVVVVPQDGGFVYVSTEGAHVNDNNPAIDFRGESWLVALRLKNGADPSPHVTRRQNWSDAPPSYRDKIVSAVTDAVAAFLDTRPDLVRAGALASLNNELYQQREALAKVQEEAKAAKATVRATERAYRKVQEG